MKNSKKILSALLMTTLLFTQCGETKTETAEAIKSDVITVVDSASTIAPAKTVTTITDTLQADKPTAAMDAKFIIKKKGSDDMGNPISAISISINGKITPIANITGDATMTAKSEFAKQQIPAKALSACGGFWAGAGDYYYAVPSANGVTIFKGSQDEATPAGNYNWKNFKEISK
jgi:hypothetical protein